MNLRLLSSVVLQLRNYLASFIDSLVINRRRVWEGNNVIVCVAAVTYSLQSSSCTYTSLLNSEFQIIPESVPASL